MVKKSGHILVFALCLTIVASTGCGGGAGSANGTSGGVTMLSSITVTPNSPHITVGQMQAFTATCVLSDKSTTDCTNTVGWSSGSTSIATMSGSTATALAAGTTTISATQNNVTGSANLTVTGVQDIHSVNHIIFMGQENRGFDQYFGMLNAYRVAQGLGADVDGLPGSETGTVAPDCTKWIACNPGFQTRTPIPAYHYTTVCTNDYSPSWNESHVDFNLENHLSLAAKNDGFAWTAGGYTASGGFSGGTFDIQGERAMGFFTERELPYYYFMATQFATSDRFFAPAPTRTQPNRLYLLAATSAGHVYAPTAQLNVATIFDRLDKAGVSWKIYYTDSTLNGAYCDASVNVNCPTGLTYFSYFSSYSKFLSHIRPVAEYFTDLQNNFLPQVAMIESGYDSGRDEHPVNNVQAGAAYAAKIINALMASQSWNDSVFFLTFDEGGATYDHVSPMLDGVNGASVPNPDGIKPLDYKSGDLCSTTPDNPACDFTRTGFRLPVLVISPFTKSHYVSHTPMDYTAILKFIETRFGLSILTKRDAAQPDMTEFFDFAGAPNMTPPSPPGQPIDAPCYYDHLP